MKKEQLCSLGLVFVAVIWGVAFSAIDYALDCGWNTFTILSIRGFIGGGLLIPFAIKDRFWKNKRLILHCAIAGVFFFLGYACQTIGQQQSSVVNSAFFTCIYVVITPFIALLFGRKEVNWQTFVGAFLALTGLFFLNFLAKGGELSFHKGDIFLILCAVFFSLQIIWIGHFLNKKDNPITASSIMLITMGLCSLLCLPFAHETMPSSIKGFGGVLFAAIFSSGVASLLQFYCQRYVNPSKASLLLGLETTFACLFAIALGTDTMNIYSGIGLVFMMLSVVMVEIRFEKKYDFSKYTYLLFDVDDTLLDFKKTEEYAFRKLLKDYHIPYKKKYLKRYSQDNLALWKKYEKGEISRDVIFEERFKPLFSELNIKGDPVKASYQFLENLKDGAFLLGNSKEELERLSKKYKLYIVSNGEPSVQYSRLEKTKIITYFEKLFISKEIGYQKPKKEFFQYVESHIPDFDSKKAIVIGDSLSSDILGAIEYNIDTCWFNPENKKTDMPITYKIKDLSQIK